LKEETDLTGGGDRAPATSVKERGSLYSGKREQNLGWAQMQKNPVPINYSLALKRGGEEVQAVCSVTRRCLSTTPAESASGEKPLGLANRRVGQRFNCVNRNSLPRGVGERPRVKNDGPGGSDKRCCQVQPGSLKKGESRMAWTSDRVNLV